MIEENVPIPPRIKHGGRKAKYPIPDMKVGNSILVAERTGRPSLAYWTEKTGAKFITRTTGDGIRVWRTE